MYKVYILLLIVIIILVLGNFFITREGFGVTSSSTDDECTFSTGQVDDDCNKIVTEDGDEFKVHNVCPLNPTCLGICINDFTWTDENKAYINSYNTDYVVGGLKSNGEKLKAVFKSSRCMECIKNFHTGVSLLNDNVGCNPK